MNYDDEEELRAAMIAAVVFIGGIGAIIGAAITALIWAFT